MSDFSFHDHAFFLPRRQGVWFSSAPHAVKGRVPALFFYACKAPQKKRPAPVADWQTWFSPCRTAARRKRSPLCSSPIRKKRTGLISRVRRRQPQIFPVPPKARRFHVPRVPPKRFFIRACMSDFSFHDHAFFLPRRQGVWFSSAPHAVKGRVPALVFMPAKR
jgi:hypothetical protein